MPPPLRTTTLSGLLLFLCLSGIGPLCTPAPSQRPSASIIMNASTVDASTIDGTLTLPGPLPTQTTDDPRFADPAFDDSAWPLVKPGQPFADDLYQRPDAHFLWVRLHLRILNARGPLAVTLGHSFYPYTVYANGRQIASTPGMEARTQRYDPQINIPLPPAQDIILAVRFYHHEPLGWSPLTGLKLGYPSALAADSELRRIHYFDLYQASELLLGLTLSALAVFFLILYRAQPHRSEYLWLALYCFCSAGYNLVDVAQHTGTFSDDTATKLVDGAFGFYSSLCSLEFVIRFTRARPRWPLRLLEVFFLIGPLQIFLPYTLGNYVVVFGLGLWFVALTYFLVHGFRSGNLENKLLLPPFALIALSLAWGYLPLVLPSAPFPKPFRIGRLGFDLNNISTFIFLLAILAVVLYRFIRVTRDEQRAAAELEAARTIQQILIPETLPSIPGYLIASVYQPAQEVGGDFFQIIPLPSSTALIILGDVSGKGMQAAMTVSLLVGALRAAAETTPSPAELLANLNRRLHGRGTGFTTCLILHLDAAGNITAANAGHLQPYLDGRELAFEPGLPLGFIPDATYPETHLTLAPSQTLTLLTDGIVEATSPTKELFGFDRTQSISTRTAQEIAAAATAFGHPSPQADDITVLTLHRLSA